MVTWQWIAGFYEGEGNAAYSRHLGKRYYGLILTIVQSERAPLQAIKTFVGRGKVYPRRWRVKQGVRRSWMYRITYCEAVWFAKKILPLMNSPKKSKQLVHMMQLTAR